jgi:hypothetical protein
MATTQPKNLKHKRPPSGLRGFPAAWTHLDRVGSDHQREALTAIVRTLGVQGAPALDYAAWQCCFLTGVRKDPPVPKAALKPDERDLIERRVREELRGADRKLFPRLSKSLHG